MDSRIREIEQWLDEAKTDLQDGGREAYLRKLYLLDAEIRAVIKENDPLPEIKQASRGHRPARKFNLPVAVAGLAALALFGSAAVLGQGMLRGNQFTGDIPEASPTGAEMTMASLSRFPQGEERISLEELGGATASLEFDLLDRNRLFSKLSSETFGSEAGMEQPMQLESLRNAQDTELLASAADSARNGMVGDIGSDSGSGVGDVDPANQYTGVDVTMAISREPQSRDRAMDMSSVILPPGEPTHTSLAPLSDNSAQSETVSETGRFNYFPSAGDSSGVDPKGPSSNANGRSSEVLLAGNKGATKAADGQVERKLDEAELKKIAEEKLRRKESKGS